MVKITPKMLKKEFVDELERKLPFVIQSHYRGKSRHADLRLAQNDHLEGWTVDEQIKGAIKKPVETIGAAKKIDANFEATSKFSNNPKDYLQVKRGKTMIRSLLCQAKAKQPRTWLKVEGVTAPGTPGATKEFVGVLHILDKGWWEKGAWKPHYKEFWLHGKKYNGKFVVRLLTRPKGFKRAGKQSLIWLMWKPLDQIPYVFTRRALTKKWIPPKGESSLPIEWEKKVPKNLRWWTKSLTGKAALKIIELIRKHFKKQKTLKHGFYYSYSQSLLDEIERLSTTKISKEALEKVENPSKILIRSVEKLQFGSLKTKEYTVRGVALAEGMFNGLYYPLIEIKKAYKSLIGKDLRVDHSKSVRDKIGRIIDVWFNDVKKQIEFEAEIYDEGIIIRIDKGLISGTSVGVAVDRIKTEKGLTAKNLEFEEISLVTQPACAKCVIFEK